MDIHDLFFSCKNGDLGRVQYLVENKEVELNVRDNWDSTPLYYACLCGHEEVVIYLLESGAKCEANTFDGERCVYGALTDKIRNILKSYKAVTSQTIRRDIFFEFLRRLLETGYYGDVTFDIHRQPILAHRCILSARSEYFCNMFKTKWKDKDIIPITHRLVKPDAFKAILQYLYTGRLEANIDNLEDIIRIARQCKLLSLMDQLEDRLKKVLSFESTKPGVDVKTVCLEPPLDSSELQMDLGVLADQALPVEFCTEADIELPFSPEEVKTFSDLLVSVEGHKFKCHKAFLCGRSDYFKALIEDHFGEASSTEEGSLPIITLHDLSASVFVQVMYFIYQDSCEMNADTVYDVLCAADLYLLPGLKRQCANVIARYLEIENVTMIFKTSRLFNLPRLEDQCAEFMASNLEKILERPDFKELVQEDAAGVQQREETDTIPIIDDIRFHITSCIQTYSDMYEADQKLALIDTFLEEQQLDA